MNICKDIKLNGKHHRPILLDTYSLSKFSKKPILILAHGFKGFKDWGHWHLIAEIFAANGFFFLKFNFSHNGTTPEQPLEFADLEAFGQNNYSKEESDLDVVLEWLINNDNDEYDINNITLIGHSRGGGLAIAKAARDERIHRLITWAAVNELGFAKRHPDAIKEWKEKGVYYVLNGRTKQQMPLYYQLHEDIEKNADLFDVEKAAKNMDKPWLIVHGTKDKAVDVEVAKILHQWNPNSDIEIIEDADHVFGGKHPYTDNILPIHSLMLTILCLQFLDK